MAEQAAKFGLVDHPPRAAWSTALEASGRGRVPPARAAAYLVESLSPGPEVIIVHPISQLRTLFLRGVWSSFVIVSVSGEQLVAQGEPEPERWQLSAEFSFTDQGGNRDLRLLTGGFSASHLQRDDFRLDLSLQSRYGRSEGELVALNHLAALGFDFRPNSTWSPFLFADAERDEFKRLDLRTSGGAGAKHTFRRSADGSLDTSLSLAALYSYEQIAALPAEPGHPPAEASRRDHFARWSLRARTSHEIREGVTVRHTTFYQPVLDEMADYLLRSDTGIKVLLTERLALSVEYQLKRDARPPVDVRPNDRLLTTGLIIDF